MPIPVEAVAGFPDGVPRSQGPRPAAPSCARRAGHGVGLRRQPIDWTRAFEAAVAEGAEPGEPAGDDLPERRQRRPQHDHPDRGLRGVHGRPARSWRAPRAPRPPTQVGSTVMPGTGGAHAWANVGVSGAGQQRRHHAASTPSGATAPAGAGSDLAVFPAADYTPANRSHFDSRDYWFAGALQKMTTGWLGRWLDLYGSADNPLQAVSLDSSISKQIRTAKAPVSAVRSLNGRGVPGRQRLDQPGEHHRADGAAVAGPGRARATSSWPARETSTGAPCRCRARCAPRRRAGRAAATPTRASRSSLQLAATLLSANLGIKVVTLDWGSFDTHGNQLQSQDPQLSTLSRALAAFKRRPHRPRHRGPRDDGRVLGVRAPRRVEQESGTDHGAGGLMMAMGSRRARRPARRLPRPDDASTAATCAVTTDFRAVYSSVGDPEWLGGDPGAVIPGGAFSLGGPLVG